MVSIDGKLVDLTMQAQKLSTLYTILPSILQECLPRLPSLRRSIYGLSPAGKSNIVDSLSGTRCRTKISRFLARPGVPCQEYVWSDICDHDELAEYFNQTEEKAESRFVCEPQTTISIADESGINWRFAQQGLSLLQLAISERTTPLVPDAPVPRQFYLHSLIYLIRALPRDLNNDEQLSVRTALPNSIVNYPRRPILGRINRPSPRFAVETRSNASLLHRILASTIVQLFLIFQFLLPHVRFLLAKAWELEKEHQLIVRLTRKGVELGRGVGEVVKEMGEGKVGEVVAGSIEWFLLGIVGGVEEGMAVIGSLSRRDVGDFSHWKDRAGIDGRGV